MENFAFVSCAEVKGEPELPVDKEVGTFEEVSIPECDVHIKEEAEALLATPVLERDPLKTEEEEEDAAGMKALDSERLMPPSTAIAAGDEFRISPVTAAGSKSCGHPTRGRRRKQTSGAPDSTSGDGFACSSCQQTFPSKYSLLLHVFIHIHGVEPPLNICRLCGEVFDTHRSLQMHCLCTHLKMKENQKGSRPPGGNKKKGKCSLLQNVLCQRDTARERHGNVPQGTDNGSIRRAQKDNSRTENSDSDNFHKPISRDANLPKHKHSRMQKGANARHIVNTSLMPPAHLKQHPAVHLVDLPHRCKDCGRYFKHQVHMQQHIRSHRKKPFVCDYCGRCFNRPVDLRQHTYSHTGEKPHVCKCGKGFVKSCSLKRHLMVHRGERPYTCDVCSKSFTDSAVLKSHVLVHTGVRAYKCEECGKSFREVGHLKRHKRVHTGEKPYVCRQCGRAFAQTASLIRHTRKHTGEKPFTCPVCFKAFADRSNWRVHKASHSRRKSLKCELCEKFFYKRNDLIKHVQVHIL